MFGEQFRAQAMALTGSPVDVEARIGVVEAAAVGGQGGQNANTPYGRGAASLIS